MAAAETDCGLAVVERYFNLLKIDEKSCLREERGFTWWAEDLAQRVWSDPPVVLDGTTLWKVHAQWKARTIISAGSTRSLCSPGLLRGLNPLAQCASCN